MPSLRAGSLSDLKHDREIVTIEPILQFDEQILIGWLKRINPWIIYIGYDNHKCKLPEPTLNQTRALIKTLCDLDFKVKLKTIRKAWYE